MAADDGTKPAGRGCSGQRWAAAGGVGQSCEREKRRIRTTVLNCLFSVVGLGRRK
jgi:hypothetical protein